MAIFGYTRRDQLAKMPGKSSDLVDRLLEIEKADEAGASIDDLAMAIRYAHNGFTMTAPTSELGAKVFRARRMPKKPINIEELGYPPPEKTPLGRLNEAGKPLFYGSLGGAGICLYECGAAVGDRFVVSRWAFVEEVRLNHFGCSFGAERVWTRTAELDRCYHRDPEDLVGNTLAEWQTKIFTRPVPTGQEHLYRLSVALAEVGLGRTYPKDAAVTEEVFGGILYPSVAVNLLGMNIALKPDVADRCLSLEEVRYEKITSLLNVGEVEGPGTIARSETIDCAFGCDDDGTLGWQAGVGGFTPLEGQM